MKLDAKDKKLIYALEKNARMPVSSLAKKLAISKQLAGYKIRRIERAGIIEGYQAIIDSAKLGYTTYRVYMKFQHTTSVKREEILVFLARLPETTIVLSVDGLWDVGLTIMVRDIYDFYGVWEKIMGYRAFIESYKIAVYSPIYHFTRTFLSPKKGELPETLLLGGKETVKYDELDIAILKQLAPNVRKPAVEIAKKLGKSSQLIINRVKSLEKRGIIRGYRPIFNWNSLGYDYYKIDINLLSHKRDEELFGFCKEHMYVFQIDKTIGGSDFEIEIYARSKDHFREIMQELQDRFHDVFRSYTYFTLGRTYKETFFTI